MEFSNLDTNNDGKLQKDELLEGLVNSFTLNEQSAEKYVDKILNSQTYHREYILYRNYPEI